LWFNNNELTFLEYFFPLNRPQELFRRIFIVSTVLISGGIINQISSRLSYSRIKQLKSELSHKATLNSINDGVISISKNNKIIHINPAAEKLIGLELKDVIERAIVDVLCIVDKKNQIELDRKTKKDLFSTSKIQGRKELSLKSKDGKIKDITFSASLLRNKDNKIEEIICVLRDVTIERDYLRKIENTKESLDNYIQSTPIGIIVFNEKGEPIDINNAAKSLCHNSIEKITTNITDAINKNLWENIEIKNDEFELAYSTGKPCNVFINSYPLSATSIIVFITDITKSKEFEKELSEKDKFYAKLLNTIPIPVYFKDITGKIKGCNAEFCSLVGLSEKELLDRTEDEVFDNNFINQVLQKDSELLVNFISQNYEAELIVKSEIKKEIVSYRDIYLNERNEIGGIIGAFVDITKLKNIEHILVDKEQFLSSLITNIPGIVFRFVNDDGVKLDYLSESFSTITGYNVEDFIAGKMTKSDIIHPEDAHYINDKFEIAKENNNFYSIEFRIINSDGEIVWINEKAKVLLDENDEITHIYGVMLNVTKEKNAEHELIENRAKLETIFLSMSEMVALHEVIYDDKQNPVNYRILDVNTAYNKMLGIPIERAVGNLATEVYGVEQAPFLQEYSEVVRTGERYEFKIFYPPVNKHFIISCLKYMENHFATITTDITDIKMSEEALKNKNKELEDYLYVASHDLRTPLVNIQGFSQRLQKQVDKLNVIADESCDKEAIGEILNTKIPKSLEFIYTNVNKMDHLISGLLKISRTGSIKMNVVPIKMDDIVSEVLDVMNFQLNNVEIEIVKHDLATCYGDKDLLEQLFMNLISNSIKYRNKSRKLIINISCSESTDMVTYLIEDNGIGIDERNQKKIWDVFYRVNPKSEVKGEGIGLSLVKRIVDKHYGRIRLESELDKGTKFYIEIPKYKFL
jgi:PAS domain S-box-containing protein